MTQRIFDIKNEKDYTDLWNILPNSINKIKKAKYPDNFDTLYFQNGTQLSSIIKINWYDKTEIIRPVPEATEQDIGKLCYFWNGDKDYSEQIGLLTKIDYKLEYKYAMSKYEYFVHCRRLTKQEIEELC